MDLRGVLRAVNRLRRLENKAPLLALPKGSRHRAFDCVLAKALEARVIGLDGSYYQEFGAQYGDRPLPEYLRKFGLQFDEGRYPELEEETHA